MSKNQTMSQQPQINTYPWLAEQRQLFIDACSNNHLPHALLLAGPAGLGKLEFAKSLAEYLLCVQFSAEFDPERAKQNAHLFRLGHHADFHLVQPEANSKMIKIDQIRKTSEFVHKTAQRGGYKVIIIHLAEQMNTAGVNALLKSLEEPQGRTVFFLITENMASLLPTLLSRCQKWVFTPPSSEQAQQWLQQQDPELTTQRSALALFLASNAPLKALTFLNTEQDLLFKNLTKDLLGYLLQQKTIVDFSDAWHKQDFQQVIYFMQLILVHLMKLMTVTNNKAIEAEQPFALSQATLEKLQQQYPYSILYALYQETLAVRQGLQANIAINQQSALERILLATS